ncbi:MAG: hypothetical protein IKO42_03820 [Opitutales bacterium]|nr:hypothetical protein [Opitutales bacterium]
MKTQKIQIKIRMPIAAAAALESRAKKCGMSLKGYMAFLLAEYCAARKSAEH